MLKPRGTKYEVRHTKYKMHLQTPRLRLRPVRPDDVEFLHSMWSDRDVRRFLWDGKEIERKTVEDVVASTAEDWQQRRYGFWIIELASGAPVGFVGFRASDDEGCPELLYSLLPEHWRHGYATEAAHAAIEYLFANVAVEAVDAATDAPNIASARVMQRLGMHFVKRGELNGLDTLFYRLERSRP